MQRSYDPLTNMVTDITVDTSALPLAKNIYDFCKNVAGKNIKMPFSRQLWVGWQLFSEWCPHCTNPKMMDVTNLEVDEDPEEAIYDGRLVLLEHGICPKCGSKKGNLIQEGLLNDNNELVLVAGQRSGKSSITSVFGGYQYHRLLKAPRYSTICRGIQEFTPLTGTFVALSQSRAIKLLWNPFMEVVKGSSWFQDYHKLLKDYGNQYGKEFFRQSSLYLRYFHRNLDLYPSGPMKRALRGDTRVWAATDELGWFPFTLTQNLDGVDEENDERERANADEVHTALSNSLATVRTEVHTLYKKGIHHLPTGYNINISSPSSWKDKICRLLKDTEGSKYSLGLRLPTWEINPMFGRDHPVIQNAYRINPLKAERDYGANPPSLNSSLYDKDVVLRLFSGMNHHALKLASKITDEKKVFADLVTKIRRDRWPSGALAIDAGLSNNSFALAAGHLQGDSLIVTTLIELIPPSGKKVDFHKMFHDVILPLIQECNIHYVFADRWNSILMLDTIRQESKERVQAIQYTLKRNDFDTFDSDFVDSEKLVLPQLELEVDAIEAVQNYKKELISKPSSHLYLQFLTVQTQNGIVTKGDGFTDDLYRALILLGTKIKDPKVKEHLVRFQPKAAENSRRLIGILAGKTVGLDGNVRIIEV